MVSCVWGIYLLRGLFIPSGLGVEKLLSLVSAVPLSHPHVLPLPLLPLAAYAVPGCDSFATPQCWLKASSGGTSNNKCRVSGEQARPSYQGDPLAAAAVFSFGAVGPAGASKFLTFAVDEVLSLNWCESWRAGVGGSVL